MNRILLHGQDQTGTIGTALEPFIVSIVTNEGPLRGALVSFKLVRGRGAFLQRDAVTDEQGCATAILVPYSHEYMVVCVRSDEAYLVFRGTASEVPPDVEPKATASDEWFLSPEEIPPATAPPPEVPTPELVPPPAPRRKRSSTPWLIGIGLSVLVAVMVAAAGPDPTHAAPAPEAPQAQAAPPPPRPIIVDCWSGKNAKNGSRLKTCTATRQ